MSDAGNRRPIKTRGWAVFQRFAAWLARVGVSPNAISLSSIGFAGLAGAAMAATAYAESPLVARALWATAAIGIQLRLIANLLDGLVAVEGGKGSAVGELYNEAPDRVSDTLTLLGAGFAAGGSPAAGAAASIVALFVAYARALGASVGAGQVFAGPMAKQHRMAIMTGVALLCAAFPDRLTEGGVAGLGAPAIGLVVVAVGGIATACNRLRIIARRLRDSAEAKG